MQRSTTKRRLFGAVLCAILALLSPGIECYAAASQIVRGRFGQSVSGMAAAFAPRVLSVSAVSFPLTKSFSLKTPALRTVPKISTPQSFANTSASAGPMAADAALLKEAPLSAVPHSAAIISQRAVLEQTAVRLSQAQDSVGRRAVLDAVFTGASAKVLASEVFASGSARAVNSLQAAVPVSQARISVPPTAQKDLGAAKIFITRAGQAPIAITLAQLPAALAADSTLKETLNASGRVRIVLAKAPIAGGFGQSDVSSIKAALVSAGVTAKVDVETIQIAAVHKAVAEVSAQSISAPKGFWRKVLWYAAAPVRETAYFFRTLGGAFTSPTKAEVAGGLLSKLLPTILSFGAWSAMFGSAAVPSSLTGLFSWSGLVSLFSAFGAACAAHPVALACALGLSVFLNVFHGVWINTWSELQSVMGRERGLNYQSMFNLIYGQFWGVIFRLIPWSALPGIVPPWTLGYWKDVGVSTIVGSFFGSLGYQGLNNLYDNGRLSRWQRSVIQQTRDFLMCLAGVFFASGGMAMFWQIFAVQQSLDFLIYLASLVVKRRPILYLADVAVAASPEFLGRYPVNGASASGSSWKQALDNLLSLPFIKPIVALVKAIIKILRPHSPKQLAAR